MKFYAGTKREKILIVISIVVVVVLTYFLVF